MVMTDIAETPDRPRLRLYDAARRLVAPLALALWAVGMASVALYVWVGMTIPVSPALVYRGKGVVLAMALVTVAFNSVSLILMLRRPKLRVGWLFVGGSVVLTMQAFCGAYLIYATHKGNPPLLPNPERAAWLSTTFTLPTLAVVVILLALVFPTGHLRARRAVPFAVAAGLGWVFLVAFFAWSSPSFTWYPGLLNLWAADPPLSDVLKVGYWVGVALLFLAALAGGLSMVLRYREADMEERHQIKWVAYAIGVSVVAGIVFLTTRNFAQAQTGAGELGLILALLAAALLPIAAAIACLRYHLYDIDLIINRTLAWVALTAVLGGLYAASIALFQRLFVALTGDRSDAAIVFTTLLLAGTFTPMRKTLEGAVDRRFRSSHHPRRSNGTGSPGTAAGTAAPVPSGSQLAALLSDRRTFDALVERVATNLTEESETARRRGTPRAAT